MFSLVIKALSVVPRQLKVKLLLLQLLLLLSAVVELTSVISIGPFIALAANPSYVHKNAYLGYFYELLGSPELDMFIIYAGIAFALFIVITNLLMLFSQVALMRLTHQLEACFSIRLFDYYLHRDYEYYLTRKPSEFISAVNNEMKQFCSGLLLSFLQVNARVVSIVLLTILIFIVNAWAALLISLILLGSYILVFYSTNRQLKKNGKEQTLLNREKTRLLHESFDGFKYLAFFGLQDRYTRKLHDVHQRKITIGTKDKLLSETPYFAIDTIALVLVVAMVIVFFSIHDDIEEVLGQLAVMSFAGYRLIPKFQAVYRALANIKKNQHVLEDLFEDILASQQQAKADDKEASGVSLTEKADVLLIENLNFTYSGSESPVLKDVCLTACAGEVVGIIGESGAGKSTFMSILTGLVRPESGTIEFGPYKFSHENIAELNHLVGFVDSSTYIFDQTLLENITLSEQEIDKQWLDKVVSIACLDTVIKGLDDGLMSRIGPKGGRLSSGQLQRIGIARALYRKPKILLFDEATNALDFETQQELIGRVRQALPDVIMIVISHRLDMRSNYDRCYILNQGRLVNLEKEN